MLLFHVLMLLQESFIKLGFHLVMFFFYLYRCVSIFVLTETDSHSMIVALIKEESH